MLATVQQGLQWPLVAEATVPSRRSPKELPAMRCGNEKLEEKPAMGYGSWEIQAMASGELWMRVGS